MAVTELTELQQFFADCRDIGGARLQRFAERDADPIGNLFRPLREETSTLKRKDRTPETIEPDRNDRRFGVVRNQFVTAAKAKQRARALQLAFRKKADNFAVGEIVCLF